MVPNHAQTLMDYRGRYQYHLTTRAAWGSYIWLQAWILRDVREQPIQLHCLWRSYETPNGVHQVDQHSEIELCTNRVHQTLWFSFPSQCEGMGLAVLTSWKQHCYMELVHKCLFKEVFLSHEDRPTHQGNCDFCAKRAKESTWSIGEIVRENQKLSTSTLIHIEARSHFLWWSVLTQ